MSDEAGIIFDGYTLSELPFINKMWDGSVLSVDRKNEPEQMIENARMTLSLMVQPGLFDRYMERKGSVARDSGFLARCLISKPATTQGKRFINGAVIPGGSLTAFHERLMELARGSIENPVRMNGIVCIFRLKRKKYLLSTIMFWSRIYPLPDP